MNKNYVKSMFYLKNELPTTVLEKFSKIPGIGSKQMRQNVKMM